MPTAASLIEGLADAGVTFVTGVPDSLLAPFVSELTSAPLGRHVAAPNEGSAVGLAAGHHLATGGVGVVYLQNSGLGNAVNPLMSLAHREVYGIPMLLIVGWRGEPGVADEPQHRTQGAVTRALLELLDIPVTTLPEDETAARELVQWEVAQALADGGPRSILVSARAIDGPKRQVGSGLGPGLSRDKVLGRLVDEVPESAVFVATTGFTSRELAAHRTDRGEDVGRDFLVVGSMGHTASVALGLALEGADRPVWCLDGDGSLAMHMGVLPAIAGQAPSNLVHVVFNNGIHESVGGQPTVLPVADLIGVALACGYRRAMRCESDDQLTDAIVAVSEPGPWFLEIVTKPGSRADLGRPGDDLAHRKQTFRARLDP